MGNLAQISSITGLRGVFSCFWAAGAPVVMANGLPTEQTVVCHSETFPALLKRVIGRTTRDTKYFLGMLWLCWLRNSDILVVIAKTVVVTCTGRPLK